MKMIVAIVRPERLEAVQECLRAQCRSVKEFPFEMGSFDQRLGPGLFSRRLKAAGNLNEASPARGWGDIGQFSTICRD